MSARRTLVGVGWRDPSALPKGSNGRALCRYCATEVSPPRRTFCSGSLAAFGRDGRIIRGGDGCVHEHSIRSNPGYARKIVYARDRGVCQKCGYDTAGEAGRLWQADHVIPVVEGGGECGIDGLRTLCTGCHGVETAELAGRRAAKRRESKTSKVSG